MTTPNLPPLKRDALRTPTRAGVWERDEIDLGRLAAAMEVSTQQTNAHQLKSIPDAWAQVQIARQAFVAGADLDRQGREAPRHVAYIEVRRNWRALLALFGLAHEYSERYQILVQPMTLPDRPVEDQAIASEDMFAAVLALLPPTAALHPQKGDWKRLGLVKVMDADGSESAVVGLLSPDLLVTPAKSTSLTKFPRIPWFRSGPADPTTVTEMKARDFYVLGQFIDNIITNLKQYDNESRSRETRLHDRMLEELRAFQEDCNDRNGDSEHFTEAQNLTQTRFPSELHQVLSRPHKIKVEHYSPGRSDCLLRLRDDIQLPLKGVIMIDDAIATDLYRRPLNDVTAWRHLQLSDAKDPAVEAWIRRDAEEHGYLVVTADDFFTDEMVRLERDSDIAGHLTDRFNDALLPLTPLVLLLMKPDQLLKNVDQARGPDNEQLVTLELPMVGDGSVVLAPRSFGAHGGARTYKEVSRPLNLAVWPDFQRRDWHWNFLQYNHHTNTTDLQTRFGVSAHQIAADLAGVQGGVRNGPSAAAVGRLREWIDPKRRGIESRLFSGAMTPEGDEQNVIQRLRFQQESDVVGELQISSTPFEALCFARKRSKNDEPIPVGMILLPRNVTSGDEAAAVAIDFGTTNTVVATDVSLPAQPRPSLALTLRDRTMFPISARSSDQKLQDRDEISWAFSEFMPLMDQATPFATVAQTRKIEGAHLESSELKHDKRPLFASNIFFFPATYENGRMQRRIGDNVTGLRNLIFGLKWDPDLRQDAKAFLRQLMIMSAAELAAEGYSPTAITWRFSYPEAQRGQLAEERQGIFSELAKQLFPPASGADPVVQAFTESEAAAEFFLNKPGVVRSLTVVLDIGGGTTDVAIWLMDGQVKKMIWHGSLRIAGGDFMTHYLVNNPALLDELRIPEIAKVRKSFNGQDSSDLRRPRRSVRGQPSLKEVAELFYSDERFPERFRDAYQRTHDLDLGRGLRHSAMTAAGGLLFYVGKVLRHLMDTGVIKEAQYEQPTIAFGGRGALFLKVLGGVQPEESARLKKLGAIMTAAVAPKDPSQHGVQIFFSPEPKLEAVRGMVAPDAENLAHAPSGDRRDAVMPIGEDLALSGESPPDAWEDVTALQNRHLLEKPKLTEFEGFLEVLYRQTGIGINLSAGGAITAHGAISDYVNNELKAQLERAVSQSAAPRGGRADPIEPPFILALRGLLDRLGQAVEERRKYLSVNEDPQ